MKLSELLVLVSILYLPHSNALLYYVSSDSIDNETCTSGRMALMPCYSLDDLSNIETLLSHRAVIKLFLLSVKYSLLQNLTARNVSQLEILPWNQQEEVVIDCQLAADFYFLNVDKLKLFSLNFTSCTLRGFLHSSKTNSSVNLTITRNLLNYAIIIVSGLKLNLSVNNCTFCSNKGALSIDSQSKVDANLLITDSIFSNNWNTDSSGAGALCTQSVNTRANSLTTLRHIPVVLLHTMEVL